MRESVKERRAQCTCTEARVKHALTHTPPPTAQDSRNGVHVQCLASLMVAETGSAGGAFG